MRLSFVAISLGIVSGLALIGLQIFLTPANMILLSSIIAVLVGILTGWAITRSPGGAAVRPSLLFGLVVGGGLLVGMFVGALIYLNLPSTHNFYSLYNQGKPVSAPLNSYLAENYVGYCSGVAGLVDLGIVVGISQLMVSRFRKRQASK